MTISIESVMSQLTDLENKNSSDLEILSKTNHMVILDKTDEMLENGITTNEDTYSSEDSYEHLDPNWWICSSDGNLTNDLDYHFFDNYVVFKGLPTNDDAISYVICDNEDEQLYYTSFDVGYYSVEELEEEQLGQPQATTQQEI